MDTATLYPLLQLPVAYIFHLSAYLIKNKSAHLLRL